MSLPGSFSFLPSPLLHAWRAHLRVGGPSGADICQRWLHITSIRSWNRPQLLQTFGAFTARAQERHKH
eukprot:824922-Alexandrium_andersonii.AAC.1